MSSALRLRIDHDTDGTAELFVELHHNAFSGKSSAWFDAKQLAEFGVRLANTYPLKREHPVYLCGGYWSNTGSTIDQLHVGLKFYPIGGTGTVGLQVKLATPCLADERPESQYKVNAEIKTSYEELRRFGLAIKSLAEGQASLAELSANEA